MIEIGNIWYGPSLKRTTAATEVIFLLARHAFDERGYRRLEWKCNALNAASRRAAERYGFEFEGVFRQHIVVKGRNRDTACYAITDDRWPAIRSGFVAGARELRRRGAPAPLAGGLPRTRPAPRHAHGLTVESSPPGLQPTTRRESK